MAQTVEGFFSELGGKIDPSRLQGMNATYQFVVTGDGGGEWNVAIANGQATVSKGTADAPSITLTSSVADWLDIVSGKLNGQTAFLTGKLKIKGDMTLAMKLQSVLQVK
ncbi:MAG: SCP2 sterol-binding domain-containing protein [Candidatus Hydrogenedentes bacterium]|nr:SCP2 sterol-binding domain-containing protein [Candidatus Hydrogenedentota bacterium]